MKKKTEKSLVSDEELQAMENYLKGYDFYEKMLTMDEYGRSFFGDESVNVELPMARVKMFEIRHFIMAMNNSSEKLMLYYHYVQGETIERCGERLGVSRSTAFRMKNRAIHCAVLHKKMIDGRSFL